jgi:acetoacetyl-CoA reductase
MEAVRASDAQADSPLDEDSLAGRVALVTGGTRGIGAAISLSLARRGATVAAGFSANRAAAEAFRQALLQSGARASVHQGNVGDPEHCLRVREEVIGRHGRLDILVNNAGVTVDRPVWTMTVDDWHKVLRVNLSGAFYMSQPALAHMRGLEGRPFRADQDAGPRGRVCAREGGQARRRGLTVNAVTPGLIETEMTEAIPPKVVEKLRAAIPSRRMGRPDEVARVVRFLAADGSAYITGRCEVSTAASTCEHRRLERRRTT